MIRSISTSLCLVLGLFSTVPALAGGRLSAVHGVPGLVVDVYVNGDLTLEDFQPGTVTDPLALEAGDYAVAITAADGDIGDAVLEGTASLQEGQFLSVVAHLAADGSPALSVFEIDDSPSKKGSRLTVVHAAAAPAVDIELRKWFWKVGKFEDVVNGDSADIDVRPGLYRAKVFPAGSHDPVLGPAKLYLKRDFSYVAYAVGSLADGTLELLTQKIDVMEEVPDTGMVTVVHGVPGLTVDVFVNGDLALDDFVPGTVTDALELPAGDYSIAITASEGGDPDDPILAASVSLEGGQNASIVAHLQEDGSPTISAFLNDVSSLKYFRGRAVVRHTAAAPAVDVKLTRWHRTAAFIEDLANGEEAQADVMRGTYAATLFPAGSDDAVFGPVPLPIRTGKVQIAYAVGSLADGSFTILVQTIDVGTSTSSSGFFRLLFGRL